MLRGRRSGRGAAGANTGGDAAFAQCDERLVPVINWILVCREAPIQLRAIEGLSRLRIGNLLKVKIFEFISAPFAYGFLQRRIAIVSEKLERIGFIVFLAHKKQRRLGGQQEQS